MFVYLGDLSLGGALWAAFGRDEIDQSRKLGDHGNVCLVLGSSPLFTVRSCVREGAHGVFLVHFATFEIVAEGGGS